MGPLRSVPRLVSVALVVLFAFRVWQRKWISDDGYIYLTYVQNWVDNGVGPVFNRGEYVEAYTSVGWFGLLSLFDVVRVDRFLTLPQMTLLISFVCSVLAAAAWIPIERLATPRPSGSEPWRLSLPLAYFAGTAVFSTFATSGLETPLLLLWLAATVAVVWLPNGNTPQQLLAGAAVVGVGPLVRPDLALPAAILGILIAVRYWKVRSSLANSARILAAGLALAFGPGLLTVVLRVGVYAQLLPNTFYAKTDSGYGFAQGWTYLLDTARPYHLWVIGIVALVVVTVGARRARHGVEFAPEALRRRGVLLLMATVSTFAVMSEGGDFMHGRMLITPWFLLLGVFAGVGTEFVNWARTRLPTTQAVWAAAVPVVTATAVFAAQATMQSEQLASGELIIGEIADEAGFYASIDPKLHDFNAEAADSWAQQGRDVAALAERLDQEVGFATGTIGRRSFYAQRDHGRVYVYDVFGLTQTQVARMEMGPDWRLRVGHNRGAGFSLIAHNPRVDFHPTPDEEFNEVFTVTAGTSSMVLLNLDLIVPLRDAGIISTTDAARMIEFLRSELDRSSPDPEMVALIQLRYHVDDAIRARVLELGAVADRSKLLRWYDAFAPTLALFRPDGCTTGWFGCLDLAVRRQRASGAPAFESWEAATNPSGGTP